MAVKKKNDPNKIMDTYRDVEFLDSREARPIRILSEFLEVRYRVEKLDVFNTVVFFGSARIKSKGHVLSKYYKDARALSKEINIWNQENNYKFILVSGGGPGIMEATNRGARDVKAESIGLNIELPFEQSSNKFLRPDYVFNFRYFFTRKFWFSYLAKAVVVFPGGFGTFDEFAGLLTLIQTQKIKKKMKIIFYGSEFWKEIVNFEKMVEFGVISKEDLKLFEFADDVDTARESITTFLEKNYAHNGQKYFH